MELEADRDPDPITPLEDEDGVPRLREPLPAGDEPNPPADADREPTREPDAEPLDGGVDDALKPLLG